MYWNAQGLNKKLNELSDVLTKEDIDVACICETHLTDKMTITNPPGYHVIRNDRATHLGGLVTIIKETVNFNELQLSQTNLLEYSAIVINSHPRTIIINTYLPGGARKSDIELHLKSDLNKLLLDSGKRNMGLVMVGDLNAKNRAWNNDKNNKAGNIMFKFVQDNNFTISYPRDHTYCPDSNYKKPSTIDLLITNGHIGSSRPYTKPIMTSDHVPVFVNIHIDLQKRSGAPLKVRNYRRANWKLFRETLNRGIMNSNFAVCDHPLTNSEIDGAVESITLSTSSALDDSIPWVSLCEQGTFISPEIRCIIKSRNYFRRRWLRSHRSDDQDNFREMSLLVKFMVKAESNNRIRRQLEDCKIGDNKIFKIIKGKKQKKIPPLANDSSSGSRLFKDEDKATALANQFRLMHVNPLERHNLIFTIGINTTVQSHLAEPFPPPPGISLREVQQQINSLKNAKAPGPDSIPVTALKNFSRCGFDLLTTIFNACITNAYYPVNWKRANTVAVHKQGKDPKLPSSYRPIALLCLFAKVFEKILNQRIIEFNNIHQTIPDLQFGFRRGHSTGHAISLLHNQIDNGLSSSCTTGVLAFDVEKAFDRVWHQGLLYKMIQNKYPDYLIKLIHSFLSSRKFRVRVGRAFSRWEEAPWGVPQGSALSPTLYNIFTADIPTDPKDNTNIILYADDTLILTTDRLIKNINDRLQTTAAKLINYFNLWKIKINADKTTLTCFTKRITKQLPGETLKIGKADIQWTDNTKYLGAIFDKRLTLLDQQNRMCAKADAAIRVLYPFLNRNSSLDQSLKLTIYKTYIRPILTYPAVLTHRMNRTRLKALEIKQNMCLRMLLNISWNSYTSTRNLLAKANVDSVEECVKRVNLKFMNNCKESDNAIIRSLCR